MLRLVNAGPLSDTTVSGFAHLSIIYPFAGQPGARQRCIGNEAKAFAGKVIDDGQSPEAGAVSKSITDKIRSLAVARVGEQCQRSPATATLAHDQLLFSIKPLELLKVNDDPLAFQHNMDKAVAKA